MKKEWKQLKEYLPDIERYFKEDCYCPNEVYSVDGFFYKLVYSDTMANLLDIGSSGGDKVYFFETYAEHKNPILLNVWVVNDIVINAERYDVSKQNIENIKKYLHDNTYKFRLTEQDELANDMEKLLKMSNGFAIID